MTRDELAERIKNLEAQKINTIAQFNRALGGIETQISMLEMVLNGDLDLSLSDVAQHELGIPEIEDTDENETD